MTRCWSQSIAIFFLAAANSAGTATAQNPSRAAAETTTRENGSNYRFTIFGGGEHQFETSIDSGGDFDVSRIGGGAAFLHQFHSDFSGAFQLNYGVDMYDFSGTALTVAPPASPWDDIHTLTASALFSFKMNNDWSVFGGPLFQSARESGGDFGDSLTGGGAIGVTYHAANDFVIGGGVAIVSRLEDNVRFIPLIVVDWHFAEHFRIRNTAQTHAISRTGIELIFEPGNNWEFAIGVASQFSRFRLDSDAPSVDGIGEDSSLPIWFRAIVRPSDQFSIEGIAGVNTSGELRLENSSGNKIASSDYDSAFFAGVYASLRF